MHKIAHSHTAAPLFDLYNDALNSRHALDEDVIIFKVSEEFTVHPKIGPGDILIIDQCGDRCTKCTTKGWVLYETAGRYVLTQTRHVAGRLARQKLRLVGSEPPKAKIRLIGRVMATILG